MPVTVVHAADLHIDSPLRGLSNYPGAPVDEIRAATRGAFENLVGACLERRADLLVIAGDVFDGTWTDFNTGLFFVQQLQRLHDSGVPSVIVHGNHDAESLITNRLRLPPSVRTLRSDEAETVLFDDIGVAVHGQSYAQRAVTSDLASAYPSPVAGLFNIGLLHTALDGRSDHDNYAPCSLATLRRRGYDYWALGHVHTREIVSVDPWVVFPGNLQGRHARETGAKGATILTIGGGNEAGVEDLTCDVVRWAVAAVDISGCRDLDDVLALTMPAIEAVEASAAGRLVAVRVALGGRSEISGALLADEDHVAAEVRALGMRFARVWIEQVRIEAKAHAAAGARLNGFLTGAAADVRGDSAALHGLVAELKAKLPPDIRESAGLALSSDAWLQDRAAEAEDLLRALLAEAGG